MAFWKCTMPPYPTLAPKLLVLALAADARAQTPIGTVDAASATVSGTLSLTEGKATLGGNAVVTARDRTATIALARGGEILVCSTSALHAARGSASAEPAPLLLALDRGAVELHMKVNPADSILTPDLRFTIDPAGSSAGPLDLRLRVAGNGDTCVENRGASAPTLQVAEQFGAGLYLVRPGQHLLFEHGSLREVVDHESSPCGCPPAPALSVADAGVATDPAHAARPGAAIATPGSPAETQHPFPAAESQGLTPAQPPAAAVPQAAPGEPHAQIAATLGYSGDGSSFDGTGAAPGANPPSASAAPAAPAPPTNTSPSPAPPASSSPTSTAPVSNAPASSAPPQTLSETAQAPPPPPAPSPHGLLHGIGGFFRHLFGRASH